MDLQPYVETIQRQFVVSAQAGGDDAKALADRLLPPLDAAIRLALQDALVAAVEEITCELAPGSVELRLRGRDPEFVITAPPPETAAEPAAEPATASGPTEADDGAMSRINLRMPDQLKARIERAATAEGLSVNNWLVRAATAALGQRDPGPRRESHASRTGQRYTGWAR
jgi:HicB family